MTLNKKNINQIKYFLILITITVGTILSHSALAQEVVSDTTFLKKAGYLTDDIVISLQQLSANNVNGGGFFVQKDSVLAEGIVAFDNANIGKQWIRVDYLKDTVLNVKWSGAIGDGRNEDGAAIQRILNSVYQTGSKSIHFPSGVFLIEKTIVLQGNIRLFGDGILLAKRINPSLEIDGNRRTSFYPTTIFQTDNIHSITIEELTFDGNWQANQNNNWVANPGQSFGTPEEYVANLLWFNRSENINIRNCTITNYSSNWGGKLGNNGVVCFNNCNGLLLNNLRFSDSRTEGIIFLKSKNIVIEKLATNNTAIWTPIHAWYCDTINIKNCEIIQQMNNKGSTFNLTSSNVNILKSKFIGGSGIDIGNEAGESFDIRNVIIDGCTINNIYFGIYSDNSIVRNFTFANNDVKTGKIGLSLYNVKNALIQNNSILANKEETVGIKLAQNIDSVIIINNTINADCGIQGRISNKGEFLSDIEITGNAINALPLNNRSDYQPFSSGIYFRKYSEPDNTLFKNITITDNIIHAEGSWIFIVNQLGEQNNFVVNGNKFNSSNLGCKRGLHLAFNNNLVVTNNVLFDCWQNMIIQNENIEISNNRVIYEKYIKPIADGVGFILRSNKGNRITQNNSMINNPGTKTFFYTPSGHENSFTKSLNINNLSK